MSMGFFLVSLISVAAAHHHRPPLVKWMRERRERLVWQTAANSRGNEPSIEIIRERKKRFLSAPVRVCWGESLGLPVFVAKEEAIAHLSNRLFSLRVNFILSRAIAVHHTRWRLEFFSFVFIWKCQLCLQVQNNKQIPEIWSREENKKNPFLGYYSGWKHFG
jgi:hypothetical protein